MSDILPIMLGLRGPALTDAERAWMREHKPLSTILFARNIETPDQVRTLCDELATLSPVGVPLIAVDQEGGRVQRVSFGGRAPAMGVLGVWYAHDADAATEATELVAALLAAQLRDVGATWVLAPCVDVARPETHAIIGDRSFGSDPAVVTALAAAHLRGSAMGGCFTCLKHAPGHGRATVDSHVALPRVVATRQELAMDMLPFAELAQRVPFMMTAHIAYDALTGEQPATYDAVLWRELRAAWNFEGLLLADDVGMQALGGSYGDRVVAAQGACDVVITAFSKLRHGMAGTVFDEENWAAFAAAVGRVQRLDDAQAAKVAQLKLPAAPEAAQVRAWRARLGALWADGAGRMGYELRL